MPYIWILWRHFLNWSPPPLLDSSSLCQTDITLARIRKIGSSRSPLTPQWAWSQPGLYETLGIGQKERKRRQVGTSPELPEFAAPFQDHRHRFPGALLCWLWECLCLSQLPDLSIPFHSIPFRVFTLLWTIQRALSSQELSSADDKLVRIFLDVGDRVADLSASNTKQVEWSHETRSPEVGAARLVGSNLALRLSSFFSLLLHLVCWLYLCTCFPCGWKMSSYL